MVTARIATDSPIPSPDACSHAHRPPSALWDRLGIGASALCLVHCLLLPALLPLLPAITLIPHTRAHTLLLIPIVASSALALWPGYRRHRSAQPLVFGIAGLVFCAAAVVAEGLFGIEALDRPLTVAGGLLLVTAHLCNLRLLHQAHTSRLG